VPTSASACHLGNCLTMSLYMRISAHQTMCLCCGSARTDVAGRINEVEQVVVAAMPVHQRRCLRLCGEHALQTAARRWSGGRARSGCAAGNKNTV